LRTDGLVAVLLSSDDDDCIEALFRPLHKVTDSIFSEFCNYGMVWYTRV